MKTDEKITLWSERIHEFQFSGQTCKTWCQEHHVPVSSMNYWMRKLKKLDEQSDTDMIFAKMPTEKEISKNETLNISPYPVRIFITNAIRIEVMPKLPAGTFSCSDPGSERSCLIWQVAQPFTLPVELPI